MRARDMRARHPLTNVSLDYEWKSPIKESRACIVE